MSPLTHLDNRDAAMQRFADAVDAIHEQARVTPPIYRHAGQLAWLFAQADRHELPPPRYAHTANDDWDHCPNLDLRFASLADLTAWAMWADAVIEDQIGTNGFVGYGFEGAINEVRVSCMYFTRGRES